MPAEVTWVGCDVCDGWFHACCVFVPEAAAEELDQFECPRCCLRRGVAFAFRQPNSLLGDGAPRSPPLKRSRRPPLSVVQALTAEAAAQPVALEEADAMVSLQRQAEDWRARALRLQQQVEAWRQQAAKAAQAAQAAQPGDLAQMAPPVGPPPSRETLLALLRESDALEVVVPAEVRTLRFLLARW